MNHKSRKLAFGLLSAFACVNLYGCSGSGGVGVIDGIFTNDPDPNAPSTLPTPTPGVTTPYFDPTNGIIPLPNDLLRDTDPTSPTYGFNTKLPGTGEPYDSFRSIQGASTAGNIIIPFLGGVDPASVNNSTILVLDDADKSAVNVTYTVEHPLVASTVTNSTVILTPVRPLKPLHTYSVILTNGLQGSGGQVASTNLIEYSKFATSLLNSSGGSAEPLLTDAQAQALEPLRVGYQQIYANAEAASGISRSNFLWAFQFGTQPEYYTLQSLRAIAAASNPVISAPGYPLGGTQTAPQGTFAAGTATGAYNTYNFLYNRVFYPAAFAASGNATTANATATAQATAAAGNYSITYTYLNVPDYVGYTTGNATNGFFDGNVTLGQAIQSKGTLPVPVLIILPTTAAGAPIGNGAKVPCVIYNHGITRQKEDAFAIAKTVTSNNVGIIALDMPLHGGLTEGRGITTSTSATNPQTGKTYASGDDYINLTHLRTSRDNIRQTVNDLFYVTAAVANGNVTIGANLATGAAAYNPFYTSAVAKPYFIGQSLGSITGVIYTTIEANNTFAALSVPGGRISSLLLNSPTFSPLILAGLAQEGVTPGTDAFTQFWFLAQTIIDDADPFNYAPHTLSGDLKGGTGSKVLIQEALADVVVPNSATTDLVNAMTGISQVIATGEVPLPLLPQVNAPFAGSGLFQFPGAGHGFLLDPTAGNTAAAQEQALVFLFGYPNVVAAGTIIVPNIPPATFPRTAGDSQGIDYTGTVKF